MDRQTLIERGKSLGWFHAIDFDDWQSPGRFSADRTPNATLLPVFELMRHIDFKGLRVLDVGTADGLVAFACEKLGAAEVVATDGTHREAFDVAHELLGSKAKYVSDLQDTEMLARASELGQFDVVVLAGFLYHLFGPLHTLAACRRLVKPGGIILVETVYTGGEKPYAWLNTEMDPPLTEQQSSYWIATRSTIDGMLKLSCFDILQTATLGKVAPEGKAGRYAVAARAVSPDDVGNRTPQLKRTQELLSGTAEIPFSKLKRDDYSGSLAYGGPDTHIEVPVETQADWIPLQPVREDDKQPA